MKVIVQNIAARQFLAADGRWVANKAEARDFFTLLRAYNFAQLNTSVRFRVLLHCTDDGYSASIVEGEGMAQAKKETHCASAATGSRRPSKSEPSSRFDWTASLDQSRFHLN
ncbi:MAG: hypothetical protein JWQ04_1068 [Pedosphaera sp.]|nr:hypothetical protein [Pedosphaera sp.]